MGWGRGESDFNFPKISEGEGSGNFSPFLGCVDLLWNDPLERTTTREFC
jgi:hypothetical protein